MRSMTRPLAWFLSAMLAIMPILPAQAAMVGTGEILNSAQSAPVDEQLQQFLDREDTRQPVLLESSTEVDESTAFGIDRQTGLGQFTNLLQQTMIAGQ